jgi:predicted transcriptional regulator
MTSKAIRMPDELWEAAQALADKWDMYLSEVIRAAVEAYVKDNSEGTS